MTERPILFSAPMVRAILDGRKTQTRRIVKPQPPAEAESVFRQLYSQQTPEFDGAWQWWDGKPQTPITKPLFCPYGAPSDTLWVRETWARHASGVDYAADFAAVSRPQAGPWRPSIHMPRWASRITLRIMDVRVERLQDITQQDAIAEGAPESHSSIDRISRHFGYQDFSRSWFAQKWEEINGPGAWDTNPWVWVVAFERGKP